METKLRELIKTSMMNKDKLALKTYKNILETAQKSAKEKLEEVNDKYIIDAAKREIKQLNDTLQYCTAGTDRYTETKTCIEIANSLLPEMVSKADIKKYLEDNHITKNMGICMKMLKTKFADSLDGKMASAVVKEYLNSNS